MARCPLLSTIKRLTALLVMAVVVALAGPAGVASASGADASNVPVTNVPVVACPSSYGDGAPKGLPTLPKELKVQAPGDVAAHLAYYTDRTRMISPVLGPRGWACQVQVGADGSTSIDVYPHGSHAQKVGNGRPDVSAGSNGACQGCVYDTVCPYIKSAGKQLGFTGLPCPALPAHESYTWLKGSASKDTAPVDDVIAFLVPSKPDAARGVVLYEYAHQQGSASSDSCTLPATERAWCTYIVNDFSASDWLMG